MTILKLILWATAAVITLATILLWIDFLFPDLFVKSKLRKALTARTGKPKLRIIVGQGACYFDLQKFANNEMKIALIGIKNAGDINLTSCKVYFEFLDPKTNIPQEWLREDLSHLDCGQEWRVSVAAYNEPIPPHRQDYNPIRFSMKPGPTWGVMPPISHGSGVIKIKAVSAQSAPVETSVHLWIDGEKLKWEELEAKP